MDPAGRPVEPTTWVDVTGQLEIKTRMLACHASQRDWLLAHHGIDEYLESMRGRRRCGAGRSARRRRRPSSSTAATPTPRTISWRRSSRGKVQGRSSGTATERLTGGEQREGLHGLISVSYTARPGA